MLYKLARATLVFIVLYLHSTNAQAEQVTASSKPEWKLAQGFGTPRLYLKTLLKERPAGFQGAAGMVANSIALGSSAEIGSPRLRFNVQPSLLYENNINGGLPFDTAAVGPFNFVVDDASRAKSGLTFGLRSSAGLDVVLGTGLLLSMSSNLGLRHSLKHDLHVFEYSYGACIKYTSDFWLYSEGCLSKTYVERDLSEEERNFTTLTFGRVLDSNTGSHDISASLVQQEYLGRYQNGIRLATKNIVRDIGVVDVNFSVSEEVKGILLPVLALDVKFGTFVFGERMQFSLSILKEQGGFFFGEERADRRWVLRASRDIFKNVQAYVFYEEKISSVDSFSYSGFGAGVEYVGFRW